MIGHSCPRLNPQEQPSQQGGGSVGLRSAAGQHLETQAAAGVARLPDLDVLHLARGRLS